jgi:hypothetical protein
MYDFCLNAENGDLAVPDLARYVFKATNVGKQDLGVLQLLRKRYNRQKTEQRFPVFSYEELIQRHKVSLDIFCLRDESLEDSDNLAALDVLALEIAEDLEAALELFQSITENLEAKAISEL